MTTLAAPACPVSVRPTLATPHPPANATDNPGLGGLLALLDGRETALPLLEVKVRTRLTAVVAHTTVEQRFANPARGGPRTAMEAIHLFPIPSRGAIVACELRCGEVVVRAVCKERQEAEATFADARSRGKRAALVTQERADVHTLRVANLPSGEEVIVRLEIVERLDAEDGRVVWRFPTVIAPRYLPGRETESGVGPGVLPNTDRVPDASRLAPPLLLGPGTKLDLEVTLDGTPARTESSLHALSVSFDGGLRIAPSGDARCDRDFVLAVTWANAAGLSSRAWTDGAYTLVHVEPPAAIGAGLGRDAMFVVDISGSMEGTKIDAARRALTAALHGLNAGDRFALTAFDDRLEHFAPQAADGSPGFAVYDSASLARADRWIAALRPRGGTEMLPAIQAALKGTVPAGRLRSVLFVTDGQAHNEQELVAAVVNRRVEAAKAGGEARFFTLGIDTAVNEALLGRLARLGGGTATFATPADDIEAVVARMEARFGSPMAIDLKVSGEGVEAARPEAEALYAGVSVGVLLRGAPAQVGLSYRTRGGNEAVVLTTTTLPATDSPLAALWARERVAMLEDRLTLKPFEEEALRPEIIRVALSASIVSRFTAFVAVEESRTVTGERVTVVQPHALPDQWAAPGEVMRSAPPPPAASGGAVYASMRASAPRGVPQAGPAPRSRAMPAAPAKSASIFGRVANLFLSGSDDDTEAEESAPAVHHACEPAAAHYESAMQRIPGAASPDAGGSSDAASFADSHLASTQSADGSFGGDVDRTAAALLVLVLNGSTRTSGLRKRNVQKAAAWLLARPEAGIPTSSAALALAVLYAAERGEVPKGPWPALYSAGSEGAMLRAHPQG